MLLIPTYVAPSATHGVGVFCARAVPGGTLIWRFDEDVDLLISRDDLEGTPPDLRERLQRYCYREDETTYVLCTDNAKFMNHSFSPNCDDSGLEGTVTLRDLEAGEELTCDYRQFDLDARRDGLAHWSIDDGRRAAANEASDMARISLDGEGESRSEGRRDEVRGQAAGTGPSPGGRAE